MCILMDFFVCPDVIEEKWIGFQNYDFYDLLFSWSLSFSQNNTHMSYLIDFPQRNFLLHFYYSSFHAFFPAEYLWKSSSKLLFIFSKSQKMWWIETRTF